MEAIYLVVSGALIGLPIGIMFGEILYKKTLVRLAKSGTTEKLPDGCHYFVVSEKELLDMKAKVLAAEMGKAFREQATMRQNLPVMKG